MNLGGNYLGNPPGVRDTGMVIAKPTPGAPAWYRAQEQVYGPSLPGGMGDFNVTSLAGYALIGLAIWWLTKQK